LRDTGWTTADWPKPGHTDLIAASSKVSRTEGLVKGPDTLFRLNSFFSTEVFRRAHITTGTVFYHSAKNQFFVAASPACDLVARLPRESQAWAHVIHPMMPVVAILLYSVEVDPALVVTEQGFHLFLENGGEKKVFKIVNDSGQPSYEFFFAQNEGRVRELDGKAVFDAARLVPKIVPAIGGAQNQLSATEREFAYDAFEIIDQLRGMNATRVLQMAGQHLSRIGLDYINLPS
jgi:hypothetical protein